MIYNRETIEVGGIQMKLIVGLGNIGKEYEKTRHNAGFCVMDEIAKELGCELSQKKFKALYTTVKVKQESILLMKPQTYMNLSGEAVREAMKFYQIDPKDLLVIYDDMDLPVGKIRIRENGSAGGQNGMKNIIKMIGTQDFARIRVGIGKDARIPVVDYVLGKFRKDEIADFESAVKQAKEAAIFSIDHTIAETMNAYNRK